MQSFTRGATVTISVVFRDADGEVTNPSSATLVLIYRDNALQRARAEIPLVPAAGTWTATWDSRGARQGKVFGHVRSDEPLPLGANDFVFLLVANQANEGA